MKIGGTEWHDPATPGEGLDLFVYPDQQVVAKWYGYAADGHQMWLIAVGKADGHSAILEASITAQDDDGHVMEAPWGGIKVTELANGALSITLGDGGQPLQRSLALQPLYVPTVPAPSGTKIVIQKQVAGRWVDAGLPVASGALRLPQELLLSVTEGSLTIKDTYASGPWNPVLRGVKRGEVLDTGTVRKLTFSVDAGRETQNSGSYSECHFGVHTVELGQIIQLTAHVQKKP